LFYSEKNTKRRELIFCFSIIDSPTRNGLNQKNINNFSCY